MGWPGADEPASSNLCRVRKHVSLVTCSANVLSCETVESACGRSQGDVRGGSRPSSHCLDLKPDNWLVFLAWDHIGFLLGVQNHVKKQEKRIEKGRNQQRYRAVENVPLRGLSWDTERDL